MLLKGNSPNLFRCNLIEINMINSNDQSNQGVAADIMTMYLRKKTASYHPAVSSTTILGKSLKISF